MHHFSQHDGEWQNRAELSCLLDILAISSRTALRNEITKEIERHTKCLVIFAKNPKVDREKLEQSIAQLNQLNQLNNTLLSSSGRIDQVLTQVDLLKCLAQRNSIPGGTCDFDLPAYHFWLNKPLDIRHSQIEAWTANLNPIRKAISLLLQFIRFSASPTQQLASAGFYQQSLDTNFPVHLLRVSLQHDSNYFAEISGGKHRFTVRFMQPMEAERAIQTNEDVHFTLNICQL
ncbi:MAG: cell division protein ZapD [Cycloclasticus sp. symbiont of Bathymodiolus heckerae]|nr:MAG: cell division protein ZapD [Cycloclasticus sp. symbiont of Bathymodiolus heckerae]